MVVKIGEIWKHYKGGTYTILLLPKNSEGEGMEPMVVYQDMLDENKLWEQSQVRFLETIEWEGKRVSRFVSVSYN